MAMRCIKTGLTRLGIQHNAQTRIPAQNVTLQKHQQQHAKMVLLMQHEAVDSVQVVLGLEQTPFTAANVSARIQKACSDVC